MIKNKGISKRIIYFGILLCLISCGGSENGDRKSEALEDFDTSISGSNGKNSPEGISPKIHRFDDEKLDELLGSLSDENPKLNSLLISMDGDLIVEEYFNSFSQNSLQKIWSITKAISNTTIGIAVDQGLPSEKDSISQYLLDYSALLTPSKSAIKIEHLMSMTSGLDWSELGGPGSTGFQLAYSPDWIEFTLKQSLIHSPGSHFNYSTGNSILLAPILKKATGMQASEFTDKHLFQALGISNYEWDSQSEFWTKTQSAELPGTKIPAPIQYKKPFSEYTNTGSGLRMRARDLCKIGQLYLQKGKWDGKQLVSENWIKKSFESQFGNTNYGYHWRQSKLRNQLCYYASGFGLQRIYIFPDLDMVVVLTQQHYQTMPRGEKWTQQFLNQLIDAIVD